MNRISRWNGSSWSSMGSGIAGIGAVYALATMSTGELVAGGDFTMAGGVPAFYWSRWTQTGIPPIARQPTTPHVHINETVSLSAICASGYDFSGPVTFQWRRNGVPITNGPGGASPGGGTVTGASGSLPLPFSNTVAALTIANARPSDSGEYTVVFANTCGTVTSNPATLTVTSCVADFDDGSNTGIPDGGVTTDDLLYYLSEYTQNSTRSDIDDGSGTGTPDGGITIDDLLYYLQRFEAGC